MQHLTILPLENNVMEKQSAGKRKVAGSILACEKMFDMGLQFFMKINEIPIFYNGIKQRKRNLLFTSIDDNSLFIQMQIFKIERRYNNIF